MMRGRWGYTRATWSRERIKAEIAEVRAVPPMGRMDNYIPPGRDATEVAGKLALQAELAERRRGR